MQLLDGGQGVFGSSGRLSRRRDAESLRHRTAKGCRRSHACTDTGYPGVVTRSLLDRFGGLKPGITGKIAKHSHGTALVEMGLHLVG